MAERLYEAAFARDIRIVEERLYEAAFAGNVRIFDDLRQEDRRILDKTVLKCLDNNRTPLHIAVMLGHANFAKAISEVYSDMCLARDRDGRNPLHLAVINGNREVLAALIQPRLSEICSDMCLARDRDGRNPLHLAAIKGNREILLLLLEAGFSLAARERTDGGGTILHLCVKYDQLKMLKIIVQVIKDSEFLNATNDEGMTVLHFAVLGQHIETIRFLAATDIDVNAKNANGKTALDIAGNLNFVVNFEMAFILENYGALTSSEISAKGGEWLEKKRDTIMIVATLIATLAFQAGLNPPGGVWQEDSDPQGSTNNNYATMAKRLQKAGEAVMAYNHPKYYKNFITVNTVAFVSSLSTILFLISGLPFKRKAFMWWFLVIMWLTVASVVLTYGISTLSITPKDHKNMLSQVIALAVVVWFGVMSLLRLGNPIRLIKKWMTGLELWKWMTGLEIWKMRPAARGPSIPDRRIRIPP